LNLQSFWVWFDQKTKRSKQLDFTWCLDERARQRKKELKSHIANSFAAQNDSSFAVELVMARSVIHCALSAPLLGSRLAVERAYGSTCGDDHQMPLMTLGCH
jgi:hypothetical protein